MTKPIYKQAQTVLEQGGIIAYPTEAVWGLGCDPYNQKAVLKILDLKQRPIEKGLILVAANRQQFTGLCDSLESAQIDKLDESWPGPTTWLIPDPARLIPDWIRGEHETVAVRVSAHPLVKALCQAFGGPIVSTSANAAGEPEIRSSLIIEQQFGDRIDLIMDGELGSSSEPSQIRDLISNRVIR